MTYQGLAQIKLVGQMEFNLSELMAAEISGSRQIPSAKEKQYPLLSKRMR